MDDFGTGYSSLSYLTRFPIDSLKLDQSFVHNIITKSNDAIVISAVIGMAKSLKQSIVAEGVETIEQLAFLQAHGCDEGQGYYFSRPAPAQQFATLLEMPCQQLFGNNGVIPFHHDTRFTSSVSLNLVNSLRPTTAYRLGTESQQISETTINRRRGHDH